MATISTDPKNKRRTVQFRGVNTSKRYSIRLGKVTKRQAQDVAEYVEQLRREATHGIPAGESALRWARTVDGNIRRVLDKAGLLQASVSPTLAEFIDDFLLTKAKEVKPQTAALHRKSRDRLVAYFGDDCKVKDITEGDAVEYRAHLLNKTPLGENSTRKQCSNARMFFRHAVRKGVISSNPFAEVPAAVGSGRKGFITAEDAHAIMDQLPDIQWRALFALSRWGGLRIPSEAALLRLGDIDWEHDRLTVHSPKTEHHSGKESRVIPLFPELRQPLEEARDYARPGEVYVVPMLQGKSGAAFRKVLLAAIKRAGVQPWPRLWHSLRASRQTELEESFPGHVVCQWLGNSEAVAKRHYLSTHDGHFDKAVQNAVLQNATLSGNAMNGEGGEAPKVANSRALRSVADGCATPEKCKVIPTGPEAINATHCSSCGYMQLNAGRDARSGAISQWLEQCPALQRDAAKRSGEHG